MNRGCKVVVANISLMKMSETKKSTPISPTEFTFQCAMISNLLLNSNFGLCTICAIVPANCRSQGPIFSAFTMFGGAAGHERALKGSSYSQ